MAIAVFCNDRYGRAVVDWRKGRWSPARCASLLLFIATASLIASIFRGWLNSLLRTVSTIRSHHAAHQSGPPPCAPHCCCLRSSRRRPYFSLPASASNTPLTAHIALDVQAKIKRDQDLIDRGLDTHIPSFGLEKRDCPKNGCKCAKGTKQGQYCGLCQEVTESGDGGFYTRDMYECSPSGACCSYGSTIVCKSSDYASACPKAPA
jgi:hypothetical protein